MFKISTIWKFQRQPSTSWPHHRRQTTPGQRQYSARGINVQLSNRWTVAKLATRCNERITVQVKRSDLPHGANVLLNLCGFKLSTLSPIGERLPENEAQVRPLQTCAMLCPQLWNFPRMKHRFGPCQRTRCFVSHGRQTARE